MVLKSLFASFFLILLASCSSSESSKIATVTEDKPEIRDGQTLFLLHCESCHGLTGDKGISGAANLKTSTINEAKIKETILNGNAKGMMPYKELITSSEEIEALVTYVKSLRN